jgi:RNA polymerase sigma-70 factor (ECF subfamily)
MYLSRVEPPTLPRAGELTGLFTASPAPTDHELLQRIRRGDEAALAALYDRHARFVASIALRILGDRELAEEVVQDTFLRGWHHVDSYDPSRGQVVAWLLGIARNRAIDMLRSRSHRARRRELSNLSETTPSDDADFSDAVALREVMTHAMSSLPTDQRQIIELAYYGGLSQAEIARQLGLPLGTVKSRTRSGMEKLRVELRPYFPTHITDEGDDPC